MLQGEPPLDELLSEPMIVLLADSDGITTEELVRLCAEVRERLRGAAMGSRSGSDKR